MNCASPPNIAANGASASGESGVPHQPARFEATTNVAPANPASPRIDGAAIGWRTTRVAKPFRDSCTPAVAMSRRSSSVLILPSLYRITMYILPCDGHVKHRIRPLEARRVVAARASTARGRPARPGHIRAVAEVRGTEVADRRRRPGRALHLPVLRGGLRATHLRKRRRGQSDR